MSVLELKSLQANRGSKSVLTDFSFKVEAGELFVIVGPNGAGKSSLLHHLAGILPITTGKLTINQQAATTWQSQDFAQRVAYLPQLSRLAFPLSVREVVRLGGVAHQWSQSLWQEKIQESLTVWGLQDFSERDVRHLSGGEQQRVQLARSWLQMQSSETALWLLDEPLSALDLHHQALVLQRIKDLKAQEKSVVLVTHDLNFALNCADKVLLIKSGKVYAAGQAAETLTAENISQAFSIDASIKNGSVCWW